MNFLDSDFDSTGLDLDLTDFSFFAHDRNSNALTIAQDMALGLAAVHWAAHANMLDVEYVNGSRRSTPLAAHVLALDAEDKSTLVRTVPRVLNQTNKTNFIPVHWH